MESAWIVLMFWPDIEGGHLRHQGKQAVHGGFWLKPDRLAGGEIRLFKPSQTFSPNPARTDRDEGAFAALASRNGTSGVFSLVKSPIEHNGH